MEGLRLDMLDVICIIAIPWSLPSCLMRFRIVDTWIPFTSQRIARMTDSAKHLSRNAQLSSAKTLFLVGHRSRSYIEGYNAMADGHVVRLNAISVLQRQHPLE